MKKIFFIFCFSFTFYSIGNSFESHKERARQMELTEIIATKEFDESLQKINSTSTFTRTENK
ncbi:MAG: hypothetical protein HOP07_08155 [Bacteriovoracaceae bacterium]|nr:hypothetical protein [Bacteriovoracaceae bacterium]